MKLSLYKKLLETNICSLTRVNQVKNPEKWHELRTTGVGGSDAGAIMGMNEYSSPLVVYMQKKGEGVFKGNAATKWGHILEDPVRQETEKELGIVIEEVPGMFKSTVFPFMNANVDGLIYAENPVTVGNETIVGLGGHEIKTSANGDGFGEDEIPDSYYCQVQHYMAVTGLPWFVLTVFILSRREGKHYVIKSNADFQEKLISAERDFWENYVMTDTIPAPSGLNSEADLLKSLPMAENVELSEDYIPLLEKRAEIKNKLKELEEEDKQVSNSILLAIYNSGNIENPEEEIQKVTATCGAYKLSLSTRNRSSVDSAALKADGLYQKYTKTTSYKELRVSGGK